MNGGNIEQENRIVVSGYPVGIAFPAPETLVDEDFLAISAGVNADRSH